MSVQNRKMRLLAAPFLGVIAILVIWPLASVISDSFFAAGALSLANYRTILTDAFYLQSFATTTVISLISTATGLVFGFLVAVALRARSSAARRTVMAFANIGANFAGVPLAMALIFLFGLNGMFTLLLKELGLIDDFNVYSFTGLIIAYCYFQVALATQNTALAAIVEKMWTQRIHNPYWKKLHDHIDARTVDNWCDDHDQILKALIRKDPHAAKVAMWQHLENTKLMLFNETSDDFEFNADRYLFAENPVVHLDTAATAVK